MYKQTTLCMTRKHLVILLILSIVTTPYIVSAETFLSSDKSKTNKEGSVPVHFNEEAIQKKNRIIRIESTLLALEKNITIIETSIKQMKVRIGGIDSEKENINSVISDLEKAENILSEAKAEIEKAKKYSKRMDPKKVEEVKQIKEMISSISSLLRESILTTRLAVISLKPMKLISQAEVPAVQNNAKAK